MSLRLGWLTDIHLNFLEAAEVAAFFASLADSDADGFLVGGDVGESHDFAGHLIRLAAAVCRPVYFVLGNHDYYRSSIARVRATARALDEVSPHLHWLGGGGVVRLGDQTALVGHGGWADGRLGDYAASSIVLTDYVLIADLAGLAAPQRLEQLMQFGDAAADHVRRWLPPALDAGRRVLMLTHAPPFAEACRYRGRPTGADWLPHLACAAVGTALRELMAARPDRELTVLCGHTHGAASVDVLPNLHVLTGAAEYGAPALQRVLTVS